jgi:dolichol-phosphate mannosyltransferase
MPITPEDRSRAPKVAVVISAYDERETIAELTARLVTALDGMVGWRWELIYVLEGGDGTEQVVEAGAGGRREIRVLHQRQRSGLGASFRRGFAAVSPDADFVVTMDADLNHQPEQIPGLLAAAIDRGADILVGSRFVSEGRSEGTPRWKLALSGALGAIMRHRFALPVSDKTSGFRVYRAAALAHLAFRGDDFAFLPEMLVLAQRQGLAISEAPIHFIYRRQGRSKMGLWSTSWSYVRLLLGWIGADRVADRDEVDAARRSWDWASTCWALAMLAAFLVSLEIAHPYYFLQDDNRDMTLPHYVLEARTLAAGDLAQFNFHQSLGTPLLASGQPAVLSPGPYLAIAVSRALHGHVFAAIDWLVAAYFALGALGVLFLGRELRLSRPAALFAAISWPLLPATVYFNVSWCIVAPLIGLLPWTLGWTVRLARGEGALGSALALAAGQTLLMLAGYPQWVVAAVLIEMMFLAGFSRSARRPWKAVGWWALAAVLSLLWSLPLLAPMVNHISHSWARSAPVPYNVFAGEAVRVRAWANGVLWPFDRLFAGSQEHYYSEIAAPAAISHLGYPALLLATYGVFALARRHGSRRRTMLICAVAAGAMLAWTLGWLSPLLYRIPILNRFRWPVRQLFCFELMALLVAALGLDALRRRIPARWLAAAVIALQVADLWGANLLHSYRGFVVHSDPVPLVEPWRDRLTSGRIVSLGHYALGGRLDTIKSIGFNYASLWGLFHMGGYDTLTTRESYEATRSFSHSSSFADVPERLDIAFLRSWGVRWYVASPGAVRAYAGWLAEHGVSLVECDPDRCLFEDRSAPPLAAWADSAKGDGLDLTVRGAQLRVATRRAGPGEVVLAFLEHPFLRATVDGAPTPLRRLPGGQLLVSVPGGEHVLALRYEDPLFQLGCRGAAGGAALALLAIAFEARGRRRRAAPPQAAGPAS